MRRVFPAAAVVASLLLASCSAVAAEEPSASPASTPEVVCEVADVAAYASFASGPATPEEDQYGCYTKLSLSGDEEWLSAYGDSSEASASVQAAALVFVESLVDGVSVDNALNESAAAELLKQRGVLTEAFQAELDADGAAPATLGLSLAGVLPQPLRRDAVRFDSASAAVENVDSAAEALTVRLRGTVAVSVSDEAMIAWVLEKNPQVTEERLQREYPALYEAGGETRLTLDLSAAVQMQGTQVSGIDVQYSTDLA